MQQIPSGIFNHIKISVAKKVISIHHESYDDEHTKTLMIYVAMTMMMTVKMVMVRAMMMTVKMVMVMSMMVLVKMVMVRA